MAATAINVTQTTRGGQALPAATAADTVNGNECANSGRTILMVENTGGAAYDLTITVTKTVDGQTPAARVIEIPAGETWVFGPYNTAEYSTTLGFTGENAALEITPIEF